MEGINGSMLISLTELALLNSLDVSYPLSSAQSRVDFRSIPPELFSVAELFVVSNADIPASPEYKRH